MEKRQSEFEIGERFPSLWGFHKKRAQFVPQQKLNSPVVLSANHSRVAIYSSSTLKFRVK